MKQVIAPAVGETLATATETARANAALGQCGCLPQGKVLKGADNLPERDDVACKPSRDDIRRDGGFILDRMTCDGPDGNRC